MSSTYGATGAGLGNKVPRGYKLGRIQQFTPEQMEVFQHLGSLLGPNSFLSKIIGGDEETFSQMEAPALKQFTGLQGNLASKFSGMGMGARKSSGFQNTANQYASDFAQGLQARRLGLQKDALSQLGDLSSMFLKQEPYEQFLTQKDRKPSFLEQLFGGGIFGGGGENMANVLKLASLFI